MESRWLRAFLLLVVIPAFLGITLKTSAAEEPDIIAEVRAYNAYEQAAPLSSETGDVSRAKALYAVGEGSATYVSGDNSMDGIYNIVTNIADQLSPLIPNSDTGLPEYLYGDGNRPKNIYGLTGMGLLMAYKMTSTGLDTNGEVKLGKANYLTAAKEAGNILKNQPLTDPNTFLSTDIVFLYGLSKLTEDPDAARTNPNSYYSAGLDRISAYIKKDPNVVFNVYDCYGDANKPKRQIVYWNLASWVEAAKLYATEAGSDPNLNTWADALMTKICEKQDHNTGGFCYEAKDSGGVSHTCVRTAGQAKVVEVLKRFYADTYSSKLEEGLACLLGLQSYSTQEGGASSEGLFVWGGEIANGKLTPWKKITLQDQCYGIQAMAYNFQTTRMNYGAKYKGTYWGANYLVTHMMASISANEQSSPSVFVDTIDYKIGSVPAVPRVDRNSEALQALYYSCKEGDIDRSGKVVAYDALQVLKAEVGRVTLNGPQLVAADRDNDGVINAADAKIILSDCVGNYDEDFPICSFLGK